MFKQGRFYEVKLIVCMVFAVILLSLDRPATDSDNPQVNRAHQFINQIKGYVSNIFTPIYHMANVPTDFASNFYSYIEDSAFLMEENKKLKFEKLQLEGMLQKFTSIKQENQRLRQLLKSSEKVSDKLLVAELLHVSTEPGVQQFVLNQGVNKSVYVGQAVIDSNGVVGQIMNVSHFTSRVLLITDIEHAIPVEILRNNYRSIAVGLGDRQHLELINVPNTVDIIVGDLLVSSGLGDRFPSGYPVGRVISIDKNPSLPFAKIVIDPIAKVNQLREVLLVWPGNKVSFTEENADASSISMEGIKTGAKEIHKSTNNSARSVSDRLSRTKNTSNIVETSTIAGDN